MSATDPLRTCDWTTTGAADSGHDPMRREWECSTCGRREWSPSGDGPEACEQGATDPLRDERLYQFEKGWRVALGYVRREGLEFFEHAEGTLGEMLAAEAIDLDAVPAEPEARLVKCPGPEDAEAERGGSYRLGPCDRGKVYLSRGDKRTARDGSPVYDRSGYWVPCPRCDGENHIEARRPTEPKCNDHDGIAAAWVCDRCGQPMGREDRCNSGLHVGPGEEANGVAVASTELVAERDALRAEVKRLRGAEPERNDERDQIAVCEHCNVVVARGGERIVDRPATVCSHLRIRTYLPADTRPAEPEAWEWRAVIADGRLLAGPCASLPTLEETIRDDAWASRHKWYAERRRPGTAPGEWERVDPEPRQDAP